MLVIYELLPDTVAKMVVWCLLFLGWIDLAGTVLSVYHMEEKLPRLFGWNRRLQKWTYELTARLSGNIDKRFVRSYPSMLQAKEDASDEEKCSLVQLFWLF